MTGAQTAREDGVLRLNTVNGVHVLWEDTGEIADLDGLRDRMQLSPRIHSDVILSLEDCR